MDERRIGQTVEHCRFCITEATINNCPSPSKIKLNAPGRGQERVQIWNIWIQTDGFRALNENPYADVEGCAALWVQESNAYQWLSWEAAHIERQSPQEAGERIPGLSSQ